MAQRYIIQRGSTFYFRWRVPHDLRSHLERTEIKFSLKTSCHRTAYARAASSLVAVNAALESYTAYATGSLSGSDLTAHLRSLWPLLRLSLADSPRVTVTNVTPAHDNSMALSELIAQFMTHKKNTYSTRMAKEYAKYLDAILLLLGDKPIASITSQDITTALKAYACLPRRNLKPYRGKSTKSLLQLNIPEEHRIAAKTVEQVKKLLQSLFVFAIHELGVLSVSPARDLRLKLRQDKRYGAFTNQEILQLIEKASEAKKLWQKWLVLLAAYTGARRSELVRLHHTSLRFDQEAQRYYIMINQDFGQVKTDNAIRQVPLHKAIIRSGFLEFVESMDGPLFPDLKPQQVTAWFTRLRESLGISARDDYANRKVFHSLRHTFITKARASGTAVEKVQQVVGHEKVKAGVTDRYTHRFPLSEVVAVVDGFDYF